MKYKNVNAMGNGIQVLIVRDKIPKDESIAMRIHKVIFDYINEAHYE